MRSSATGLAGSVGAGVKAEAMRWGGVGRDAAGIAGGAAGGAGGGEGSRGGAGGAAGAAGAGAVKVEAGFGTIAGCDESALYRFEKMVIHFALCSAQSLAWPEARRRLWCGRSW